MSSRTCPDWPDLMELAPELQFKHYTVAEAQLPADALMDLPQVVAILGLPAPDDQLHAEMAPRGYRLLHRLPQLSAALVESLVRRFGTLPEIMSASASELESVEGIGTATARLIRDGLARMVEASIFERYE